MQRRDTSQSAVRCLIVATGLAAAAVLPSGCRVCEPGATQVCQCGSSKQGVQICNGEGSGWGECKSCETVVSPCLCGNGECWPPDQCSDKPQTEDCGNGLKRICRCTNNLSHWDPPTCSQALDAAIDSHRGMDAIIDGKKTDARRIDQHAQSDHKLAADTQPPKQCGNGVVDPGETCDTALPAGAAGACPTLGTCTSSDPCTEISISGDKTCQAKCSYNPRPAWMRCTPGTGTVYCYNVCNASPCGPDPELAGCYVWDTTKTVLWKDVCPSGYMFHGIGGGKCDCSAVYVPGICP